MPLTQYSWVSYKATTEYRKKETTSGLKEGCVALRLLVNIRGCNGAGKSTIPMLMMERDPSMQVVGIGRKNGKPSAPYITIFPKYEWIALGTYFNKTGGLDTYKNNEMTWEAMKYVLDNYPEYDILMEGVIASTIKSTYKNWFKEIQKTYRIRVIIMSFLPPLEVCIDRVYARNGGKPIKEEQIAGKWRTVSNNVQYFKENGLTSLRMDTSKCTRDRMLHHFLKTTDKHKAIKIMEEWKDE